MFLNNTYVYVYLFSSILGDKFISLLVNLKSVQYILRVHVRPMKNSWAELLRVAIWAMFFSDWEWSC